MGDFPAHTCLEEANSCRPVACHDSSSSPSVTSCIGRNTILDYFINKSVTLNYPWKTQLVFRPQGCLWAQAKHKTYSRLELKSRSEMKMVLLDNLVLATTAPARKQPRGVSVPLSSSFPVTWGFLVCVLCSLMWIMQWRQQRQRSRGALHGDRWMPQAEDDSCTSWLISWSGTESSWQWVLGAVISQQHLAHNSAPSLWCIHIYLIFFFSLPSWRAEDSIQESWLCSFSAGF